MSGQVGLVVHPRRDLSPALDVIEAWASKEGFSLGQVRISGQERAVAEPVDVASCDFVIAGGGDGTPSPRCMPPHRSAGRCSA
jgi:hypothetical protein